MEEMIGVIKMFAGNFAPKNFLFCNGALLSIAQNQALFSILGTTYGGDGISTFALPNLNGRAPIGAGTVSSTKSYMLGEAAGTPQTTLMQQNLPSFVSQLKISNTNANSITPTATSSIAITGRPNGREFDPIPSFVDSDPNTVLNAKSVSFIGQNQPINNMQPYLAMNYIICIYGIYPSRS